MDENETLLPSHCDQASALQVLVADQQSLLTLDHSRLQQAVRLVLEASRFNSAIVSLAVVDDPTIHEINQTFLKHDYPTDVLSFALEADDLRLEGELVVSAETALRHAPEYGWGADDELLLYVVHGALHLVGYRDKSPDEIDEMHAAEALCLQRLGISLPAQATRWKTSSFAKKPANEAQAQ